MPWLIVVGNSKALKWIIDEQRMAFRSRVDTQQIKLGDQFALYTSRQAYNSPNKDCSQVIATGRILSEVKMGKITVAGEAFPKSCTIQWDFTLPWRQGVDFRPLVPSMNFIDGNPRRWAGAVHRTLVSINTHDFDLIEKAVKLRLGDFEDNDRAV